LGEIRLGEMGLGEMGLGEMGQNQTHLVTASFSFSPNISYDAKRVILP